MAKKVAKVVVEDAPAEVGAANRRARSVFGHSRWRKRLAWAGGFALLLLVLLVLLRVQILTGLANFWVVNDAPAHADVIVVLGGAPGVRPIEAARLFAQGVAARILYMDVKLDATAELGLTLTEKELTHRVLLAQGVPEAAMTAIGNGVASTYDESQATLAWARTNGVRLVLITTDLFHTRRARWIFAKEFKSTGVQVFAHPVLSKDYGTTNWWAHESGLITFQNELFKSAYYWIKY